MGLKGCRNVANPRARPRGFYPHAFLSEPDAAAGAAQAFAAGAV